MGMASRYWPFTHLKPPPDWAENIGSPDLDIRRFVAASEFPSGSVMTVLPHDRPVMSPAVAWPRSAAVVAGILACAMLLDAWDRPVPGAGMLWLDLAAALTLGWSLLSPGASWRLENWLTPFDGRIVAGLVIALLDMLHAQGAAPQQAWLHQLFAGALCYYAFVGWLRGRALGPDALWLPFGMSAAALGVAAILHFVTAGIGAVAVFADVTDAAWAAEYGAAKTLVFATLVAAGRACEREASPLWKIATLLGAAGCTLHGLAGGIPLETRALVRLDEPLYFSTMAVTMLMLIPLTRLAWLLRRERPEEAPRWAGLAFGFSAVAFMGVLGEATGGEGVRILAVMGGAAVVVGRDAPKRAAVEPQANLEQPAAPMARAA